MNINRLLTNFLLKTKKLNFFEEIKIKNLIKKKITYKNNKNQIIKH